MKINQDLSGITNNWNHNKVIIKKRWNGIVDEDIEQIEGRRSRLMEILIDRFDLSPEEAEYEINSFWD